jgi:addiction module RelB/DinJ family antitoxin
MNTAVINIKTNPEVKAKAQKVAEELGFSLSSLINGYLRHLVKTRTAHFTTSEEPTEYLIQALKESEKDIKAGRVSPSFDNADDAVKWLNNPNAKYANGDKV